MTIITPTGITGINSITSSGSTLVFQSASGTSPVVTGLDNISSAGVITATRFVGNLTGNVNSSGVSTISSLNVGIGGTILTTISDRGIGIGTNSYASAQQARFAVSNSSETFEFSPGWDTYNGGVIEYLNRFSSTIRPDLNFYTSSIGNGSIKFWTGGSERFRITGIGGSVGIGITNPLAPLHLNSTANPAVVIGPSVSTRSSSDVGFAKTFFVYVDRQPSLFAWGDTTNRDTLFTDSLYVRTPVRDGINNPAIVIAENGGQASGRNSLVFWNDDGNSGKGYIKSRIYTEVGGSYNSTAFYIDVADSNRAIQNRLKIDVAGRVTMPFQPAFQASGNQSTTYSSQVVPFNVSLTNNGSNYSTGTYRFTAPVAGYYFFTLHAILGPDGSGTALAHIRRNGTIVASIHRNTSGGVSFPWEQGACSAVLYLAVSDYVDCFISVGTIYCGNNITGGEVYSAFNGHLIG